MSLESPHRRPGRLWPAALLLIGLASGLVSCGFLGVSIMLVVFGKMELSHFSEEQNRLASRNRTLQMQVIEKQRAREDQILELRRQQELYASLLEKAKRALPESREVVRLIRQDLEKKRAQETRAIARLQEVVKSNEQTAHEWKEKIRRLQDEGKEWSAEETHRVRIMLVSKYNEILILERQLPAGNKK